MAPTLPRRKSDALPLRDATLADVDALVALEHLCFKTDRLSARSFRRFIKRAKALLVVSETQHGDLAGYILVLFHPNTALARLYSLAVAPDARGRGMARTLLEDAEARALAQGAARMRLEVRPDNTAAHTLYRSMGYRVFAARPGYYEDDGEALRMEKLLVPRLARSLERVPYYPQTLNFTCGPAALMMAMKALDPSLTMDRNLEIQVWREATTVFMTSGHGGCGPLGLALAAHRRGFDVAVSVSDATDLFTASVRSAEKKDVIRLVEQRFHDEAAHEGIHVRHTPFTPAELCDHIKSGAVPVMLISLYRLTADRAPHWVALTACDDTFIYINDPFTEAEDYRFESDCIGIPIRHDELARMMRLGRARHFAGVIVKA